MNDDNKRYRKELTDEIKNFNDNLLRDIKRLTNNKELYALLENKVYSNWGKLNKLEASELILTEFYDILPQRDVQNEANNLDLQQKIEYLQKSVKSYQLTLEQAEQKEEETNKIVEEYQKKDRLIADYKKRIQAKNLLIKELEIR